MKCPECGRIIGHESWCPDYREPLYNPVDNFLKNNEYGEPPSLVRLPEPLGFELEPLDIEPIEPLIPEREPFDLFQENKPSFLKNALETGGPFTPLNEPMFKPQQPILPEPMIEKPQFISPPTGIVRNDLGHDTGIRFTDGGIIRNDLGHSLGRVDQNLIYNDLGHLTGKVTDGGRIMDLNGMFTGDIIDKTKL